MDLKTKLADDLKEAIKTGQTTKKETIRMLRSAIRNAEIEAGRDLTGEEYLDVINKQAKQRRDSIEQFQKAERSDLVAREEQELNIIQTYLPQQLSDDEIADRIKPIIARLGITDMRGMGAVMQEATASLKGVADGKRISQVVRRLLG